MTTVTTTFGKIGREELKAKLDRKENFRLWNVLTPEYYKPEKNIPGTAKWVPVNDLEKVLPDLNVKKEDEIVVYCGSFQCPSSKQAAEKLARMGFTKVSAYEGGVADWAEAGLPLVPAGS